MESVYSMVEHVVAPGAAGGAHVVDYEIQRMLSQGWQSYVEVVRARAGTIPDPVARQITTTFETECHGEDELWRGVRAVSRTRRSYVLDVALWQQTNDAVVARSTVVLTGIDRATGRAAEIPDVLWEAVETIERRSIPIDPVIA